ncbi:atherin-like [Sus scrofa]|uniref:atherin-like n=1 Tax=Sus scrofa TaxID=9823 RepID=UPI000A2B5072|nr:atherin-like [Sus scrofa]
MTLRCKERERHPHAAWRLFSPLRSPHAASHRHLESRRCRLIRRVQPPQRRTASHKLLRGRRACARRSLLASAHRPQGSPHAVTCPGPTAALLVSQRRAPASGSLCAHSPGSSRADAGPDGHLPCLPRPRLPAQAPPRVAADKADGVKHAGGQRQQHRAVRCSAPTPHATGPVAGARGRGASASELGRWEHHGYTPPWSLRPWRGAGKSHCSRGLWLLSLVLEEAPNPSPGDSFPAELTASLQEDHSTPRPRADSRSPGEEEGAGAGNGAGTAVPLRPSCQLEGTGRDEAAERSAHLDGGLGCEVSPASAATKRSGQPSPETADSPTVTTPTSPASTSLWPVDLSPRAGGTKRVLPLAGLKKALKKEDWSDFRHCRDPAGSPGQRAGLSPSFAKPAQQAAKHPGTLLSSARAPDPCAFGRLRGSDAQEPAAGTRHFAKCSPHSRLPSASPHPTPSAAFFLRYPAPASPPPARLSPGPPRLFPGPQPAVRLRLLPRDRRRHEPITAWLRPTSSALVSAPFPRLRNAPMEKASRGRGLQVA